METPQSALWLVLTTDDVSEGPPSTSAWEEEPRLTAASSASNLWSVELSSAATVVQQLSHVESLWPRER